MGAGPGGSHGQDVTDVNEGHPQAVEGREEPDDTERVLANGIQVHQSLTLMVR